MRLRLSYNHRDDRQPQTFTYGDVGPLSTWDWVSFVTEYTYATPPYLQQTVHLRGEGEETYTPGMATHFRSRATLVKVTRHFYDGAARRTATRDPLGRLIQQEWSSGGSLNALIDGNGNRTTWERDVRGRVTREVRADNVTDTLYTYDASGRLRTVGKPLLRSAISRRLPLAASLQLLRDLQRCKNRYSDGDAVRPAEEHTCRHALQRGP